MTTRKVYEGRAELNIQPWLDSLKQLENSTGLTATNIGAVFTELQNNILRTAQAARQGLAGINEQASAIRTVAAAQAQALVSGANAAEQTAAQATRATNTTRQQAQLAAAQIRQQSLAEAESHRQKIARLREEQQAFQTAAAQTTLQRRALNEAELTETRNAYQRRLDELQRYLAEATEARQRAEAQAAQRPREGSNPAEQRELTREYQQRIAEAQRAAQVEQLIARQTADVRRAIYATETELQRRLTGQTQVASRESIRQTQLAEAQRRQAAAVAATAHQEELRQLSARLAAFRENYSEEARLRRYATNDRLTEAQRTYQLELQQLEKYLAEVRARRQAAEYAAIETQRRPARNAEEQGTINQTYRAQILEAQRAAQIETQLIQQVANARAAARNVDLEQTRRQYGTLSVFAAQSANEQARGWERVRTAADLARERLQAVEDEYNSIYRAGSQLTQLGSMMTSLARQIGDIGLNLAESAGDFDFWVTRAVAATKAVNEQFGATLDESVINAEQFRDLTLQVGRDIGVLSAEEVSESFFTYQAALGTPIETAEDLATAQGNLNMVLRAAVVTNTDADTTIRGVAGALGQFDLSIEDLPYALAVMTNATQVSMAEFENILETFKYVGPQADRLGMSLADVGSITVALAEANIRGSQAGRLFASGLVNLVNPTRQMESRLQEMFITSRGLTGSWRDLLFVNGQLRQVFTTVNEDGAVTTGLLDEFSAALRDVGPAQTEAYLAAIFGKEAGKVWSTLVVEYNKAEEAALAAGEGSMNALDRMAEKFSDPNLQLKLFGEQWSAVSESIKVQMGLVTFLFDEFRIRLGTIVAGGILPAMKWIANIALGMLDWAEANPRVAATLVNLAVALTAILGIGGAFLIIIGGITQGIAGLPILLSSVSSGLGVFRAAFGGVLGTITRFVPLLAGTALPLFALIAIVGLLASAWLTNFGNIRTNTQEVFGVVGQEIEALLELIGSLIGMIAAILAGDQQAFAETGSAFAEAFVAAFYVIPLEIGRVIAETLAAVAAAFGELTVSFFEWGFNLVASLVEGMFSGRYLVNIASALLATDISAFFKSYSPPKVGPLREIDKWGRNLAQTFAEGMRAGDISAVTEAADRISEAFVRTVEAGISAATEYVVTVSAANNLVDDMLSIVRDGGRVTAEFFAELQPALGEWYDYLVDINLAYQEVYANERQLQIERERLELIQQQRESIQQANELRQEALNDAFAQTVEGTVQFDESQIVDPLSPEGQAKIAQMRRDLSQEEFGNWIAFQQRLWDQRTDIEDRSLEAQEQAVQAQVDAISAQVAAAKEQYDYYVAVYEYAVKLYELQEEQSRLVEQQSSRAGGGGGGAGRGSADRQGDTAALNEFRNEIRNLVGTDQALLDELALRENRGGDEIGGLGDAVRQQEREQDRIAALDALNRKKRAQAEVDLVNATSDAERDAIRARLDAWDAAYREEKARLQERAGFAREVADAAEELADATLVSRIAPLEAEFQEQIAELMGEQTEEIKDANELKEEAGSLDQASIRAREQLRDEERRLRDLQAEGDRRRLDYERRIREAANDPERLRRIEEEQEAWEAAYEQALEAQQARVEAARRASQDLGEQAGSSAGSGGRPSGGFGVPDIDTALDPEALAQAREEMLAKVRELLGLTPEDQEQATKTTETLGKVRAALKFLQDESIPTEVKVRSLARAIQDFFGFDSPENEDGTPNPNGALNRTAQLVASDLTGPLVAFQSYVRDNWPRVREQMSQVWGFGFDDIVRIVRARIGENEDGIGGVFRDGLSGIARSAGEFFSSDTGLSLVFGAGFGSIISSASKSLLGNGGLTSLFDQGFQESLDQTLDFFTSPEGLNVLFSGNLAAIAGIVGTFFSGEEGLTPQFESGLGDLLARVNKFFFGEGGSVPTWEQGLGEILRLADGFFLGEGGLNLLFTGQFEELLVTATNFFLGEDGLDPTWRENLGRLMRISQDFFTSEEGLNALFEGSFSELVSIALKYLTGEDSGLLTKWESFREEWGATIDGFVFAMRRIFTPIDTFLTALSNLRFPSVPDNSEGDGTGGGGGGGYALGLDYVPYNNFRAVLHQGERVLTAVEAAQYRQVEGLLASMGSVAPVGAKSAGSKTININVDRLDATSPDQGKNFLQQIAFLST